MMMYPKLATDTYRDKNDGLSWRAQWPVDNPGWVLRSTAAKQDWHFGNVEMIAKRNEKIAHTKVCLTLRSTAFGMRNPAEFLTLY